MWVRIVVIVLCLALAVVTDACEGSWAGAEPRRLGQTLRIEDLRATSLRDGSPLRPADFDGHPVVVLFTWMNHAESTAQIQELARLRREGGLRTIVVLEDMSAQNARGQIGAVPDDVVVYDEEQQLINSTGIDALPALITFDSGGHRQATLIHGEPLHLDQLSID